MAETYCGKTCAGCDYKETLSCPGCRVGPGARFTGSCDLAKCCVSKGHDTCESCNLNPRCGPYRGRERVPSYRIRAEKAEEDRQEEICVRTKGLYKVFFLLFWLIVPNTIGSLMTEDFLAAPYPVLASIGGYITLFVGLIYACVLLFQFRRDRNYLAAGMLWAAAAVLRFIGEYFAAPDGQFGFATIIGLVAGAIQLVGIYKEFTAHGEALVGIGDLSEKWQRLWYWVIGIYGASLGGLVITMIIPILGLLVVLVSGIATIIVDIEKLVYLYRSAKACRYYEKFDEAE